MNSDCMPDNRIGDDSEYFRSRIESGELREEVILFVWKNCHPEWTISKADMTVEKIYSILTADFGDL